MDTEKVGRTENADNNQAQGTEGTTQFKNTGKDCAEPKDGCLFQDGNFSPESRPVGQSQNIQARDIAEFPGQSQSSLVVSGSSIYGRSPGLPSHVNFSKSANISQSKSRHRFRRWSWGKGNTDFEEKKETVDRSKRKEINDLADYDKAFAQFQQSATSRLFQKRKSLQETSLNQFQMGSITEGNETKSTSHSLGKVNCDLNDSQSCDTSANVTPLPSLDCQKVSPFIFPKVKDLSPRTSELIQNAFVFPSTGLFQRRRLRSGVLRLQSLGELVAGKQLSSPVHGCSKDVETPSVQVSYCLSYM